MIPEAIQRFPSADPAQRASAPRALSLPQPLSPQLGATYIPLSTNAIQTLPQCARVKHPSMFLHVCVHAVPECVSLSCFFLRCPCRPCPPVSAEHPASPLVRPVPLICSPSFLPNPNDLPLTLDAQTPGCDASTFCYSCTWKAPCPPWALCCPPLALGPSSWPALPFSLFHCQPILHPITHPSHCTLQLIPPFHCCAGFPAQQVLHPTRPHAGCAAPCDVPIPALTHDFVSHPPAHPHKHTLLNQQFEAGLPNPLLPSAPCPERPALLGYSVFPFIQELSPACPYRSGIL